MGAGDLAADLRHHLYRHRLVAFVIQELGSAAFGVVANHAFEIHERTIFAAQQFFAEAGGVDRLASQREKIALLGVANLMRVAA